MKKYTVIVFFVIVSVIAVSNDCAQQSTEYDLILKGGHVIDPANNINGIRDIAIKDGKIARIDKNIPSDEPKLTDMGYKKHFKVIDVSGYYVTPGLIDIHIHAYNNIIADDHCFNSGVTTCVDAGSSGAENFEDFKEIIDSSRMRILAFLNIADGGMNFNAEQNPLQYNVQRAVETAKKYPDIIVGFKAAHYWRENEPYDDFHTPWANVDSAEAAGSLAELPVMFDWFPRPPQGEWPERSYREFILEKMRPGDIHTHNYARHFQIIMENGKLNPDILNAQKTGRIFDVGHGGGSFVWRNAVPAIKQGYLPNSISTDLHSGSTNGSAINMINVMSKFLCIGMSLEEVIRCSTVNSALEINRPELGTLSVGSPADIAVIELLEGDFTYLDTSGGRLRGDEKLQATMAVFDGNVVFDPTGLSYPYWEDIPKESEYWVNNSGQHY
ncbi:amidohydrolase family protein [Candidatus Latescibacterota bacterium]